MAKVIGSKEGYCSTILVYDSVPEGWRVMTGAVNHPNGYRWICKNVSIFSKDYDHGLVPEDKAIEWWMGTERTET